MAAPSSTALLNADATIVDIQWRVDIVLSSLNEVEQVAVPIALVSFRLSNHMILSYRLRPEELHQWRFSLAKGVRDLLYLQKKAPQTTKRAAHAK